MIQANELRIGNYIIWVNIPVKFTGTAYYGSGVWGLRDNKLMPLFNYGGYEYYQGAWENLFPIPLTPEILEKCNIKGKHFCDEFFIETNMSGVLIGRRPYGVKYLRHVKYVHQLQNLYVTLTGEELNIEL